MPREITSLDEVRKLTPAEYREFMKHTIELDGVLYVTTKGIQKAYKVSRSAVHYWRLRGAVDAIELGSRATLHQASDFVDPTTLELVFVEPSTMRRQKHLALMED